MNDRHDHAYTSPDQGRVGAIATRRKRPRRRNGQRTRGHGKRQSCSGIAGWTCVRPQGRERRRRNRAMAKPRRTFPRPGGKRSPACPGRRSSWRSPCRGASRAGRLRTLATEFAGGADPGPDQSVRSHGPHGRGRGTRGQPDRNTLPGQSEAFQTANMFARATGYIAERRVDIGSRVKKGDLLVHIAAPDLDEQVAQAEAQLGQVEAALNQARAQVTQAQANLSLQTTNLARTNDLTQRGFETVQNQQTQQTTVQSQQANLATAEAGVKLAEANVRAQQASVDRLRALAAFENVVAPFDGVVTARNVDVGDLVNADTGSGTPMFTVEEDDVLRISVHVPQYSSAGIRDGLEAKHHLAQTPGRVFSGKVARSSVALLYSTRTLTTQVDVPNPTGRCGRDFS